ncbi:TetR/AcrR family transcriptional regulator [Microlunatus speluncae]|uniref:TetR/AcrR family transcriptional regulator n=1 Tax=Microlunatus speluncae TaxID=2594267 RepID=UPI0024834FAF|nr:TetR/AcrR family transcriptional regulator [Microlunatus speluncae]
MALGKPNRDRRSERRAAVRAEILDAAWAVARERGLAGLTLNEVASRIGMRAPSLYSHFASKNAIYDAMFGQAWTEYDDVDRAASENAPSSPRERVRHRCLVFFDFAVADLVRTQLMNQRTIPDFSPSEEAFAPSVRAVGRAVAELAELGITDRGDIEILFAVIGGLADQQLANDPGGDSRRKLIERAADMWADGVGLPADRTEGRER